MLLTPDLQAKVLDLESFDGAEPMSERALRAVAHAGNWVEQRAAWTGPAIAQLPRPNPLVLKHYHRYSDQQAVNRLGSVRMPLDDRWLSVDEIAEYLGVSKDTVYTWVTSKATCPTRSRSSKATDEAFAKDAVKIRCCPRVTHLGGATRTSVGL